MRVEAVAASGAFDEGLFLSGVARARAGGVDLTWRDPLQVPRRYLAAADEVRLEALIRAFEDPSIDAIWMARGGYGLTRLLDRLPPLPPKPVIGFSDTTALFCATPHHPHVHGPVLTRLATNDPASQRRLFDALAGAPLAPWVGRSLIPGRAAGRAVGGNLCVLAALCGTKHQLDATGAVVFLEDTGEPAYKLDRMLMQLVSAGVLRGAVAVAIGELHACKLPPGASWTHDDVLRDLLEPLGVPVVCDLPFGHGDQNQAFRWGRPVALADGVVTFEPTPG